MRENVNAEESMNFDSGGMLIRSSTILTVCLSVCVFVQVLLSREMIWRICHKEEKKLSFINFTQKW